MIFEDGIVVVTKPQLRALAAVIYSGDEERVNISGLSVDLEALRLTATDGHRLLTVGPTTNAVESSSMAGVVVPCESIQAALRRAKPTSAISFQFDGGRIAISVIHRALSKEKFTDEMQARPVECAEDAASCEMVKPVPGAAFPAVHNVMPKIDNRREAGAAIMAFGSNYLADLALVGKSIPEQVAGGAVARLHMPKPGCPLDPILFTLDDRILGVFWYYLVMPCRM